MPNNVRIGVGAKDDASPVFDRIRAKGQGLQKDSAAGFGIGVGAAVGAKALGLLDMAASSAIDSVVGSIHAASDLNETISKSNVIFGSNADAVQAWASNMDDAAGQSEKAALDAASGFAGLFKTVGLGINQSTEYAKGLTQLGSDLASFFNTDVDEALAALKSGLNGESEPLRKFNVFLSETAVSAKLAEMGVKKVDGRFTEAQKSTARYALIMEQTGDAQGDFARTSDGMANSSRILDAKLENLSARVGQVLIPAVEKGITALLGFADAADHMTDSSIPLGDRLLDLGKIFGNLQPAHLAGEFTGLNHEIDAATGAAEDAETPFKALTGNLGRNRKAAEDAAAAHSTYAIKTRIARSASDRLADKVADLVGDFKDLDKWAENAGDTLAESAYGPEELRLKFEGVRLELKDNEKQLGKTGDEIADLHKKGKPVPVDLKRKFNDLKQSVNDGKQEVIRLGTKLEATGSISMADLRKQFALLGIKMTGLTGDAKTLWYYMNLISNTDLGTAFDNNKKGKGGKAIGGPVQSGETYVVGEKGPELFSPSMSGYIIPNNQLQRGSQPAAMSPAGGGWGPVTVVVQAPVLTPGAAQAVADAIGPALTRWQQQRNLISR